MYQAPQALNLALHPSVFSDKGMDGREFTVTFTHASPNRQGDQHSNEVIHNVHLQGIMRQLSNLSLTVGGFESVTAQLVVQHAATRLISPQNMRVQLAQW